MRRLGSLLIIAGSVQASALNLQHLDRVTPSQMAPIYSKLLKERLEREIAGQPPLVIGPDAKFSDFELSQEVNNVLKFELNMPSASYAELLKALPAYARTKYQACSTEGQVRNVVEDSRLSRELCPYISFEVSARRAREIENAQRNFRASTDLSLAEVLKRWNAITGTEFSDYGATDWYFIGAARILSSDLRPAEVRKAFGYTSYMPEFLRGPAALDAFFGEGRNMGAGFKRLRDYVESSKNVRQIWFFGGDGPDHWVKVLVIIDRNNQAIVLEYNYG